MRLPTNTSQEEFQSDSLIDFSKILDNRDQIEAFLRQISLDESLGGLSSKKFKISGTEHPETQNCDRILDGLSTSQKFDYDRISLNRFMGGSVEESIKEQEAQFSITDDGEIDYMRLLNVIGSHRDVRILNL